MIGVVVAVLLMSAPAEQDSALREYRAAIQQDGTNLAARLRLATRLAELGRLPEARSEFQAAAAAAPSDLDAAYGLAVVTARLSDWEALAGQIDRLPAPFAKQRPGDAARLCHALGAGREQAGDAAKAEESYRRALSLEPGRPATGIALAALLLRAPGKTASTRTQGEPGPGRVEAATKVLESVDLPVPEEWRAPYADTAVALASTEIEAGHLRAADRWLDRAAHAGPPTPSFPLSFNQALLAYRKGKIKDARTAAEGFPPVPAAFRPSVVALHYNLAIEARRGGDTTTAEADLRRALEHLPGDAPSNALLARLLAEKGRFAEAVAALRQCPADPECRMLHGDTLAGLYRRYGKETEAALRRGEFAAARSAIKAAIAADPTDDVLKERIAGIDAEEKTVLRLRSEMEKDIAARRWDEATEGLARLRARTPEDPSLPGREADLERGLAADLPALRKRAEDAEKKGDLYLAATRWGTVAKAAPDDAAAKRKAAEAGRAWRKVFEDDRGAAQAASDEGRFADARKILGRWKDQGLRDERLGRQLETIQKALEETAAKARTAAETNATEGKWGEALQGYLALLELIPDDPAGLAGRANSEAHLDPARGVEAARALYTEGVALYSAGQYREAIAKWNQVLALPGAGEWATRAKGHIERAQKLVDSAQAASPPGK